MAERQSELDRARGVQAAMLPDAPSVPGLEIAAAYRACEHVGGDFYDFVVVDAWHLGFVIADVSGHGTAAALVMAAAKKTLQLCGRGCLSPREALLSANEHLAREIPRGMFVSVCYGVLDIRDGGFTFARAGHNPLLIQRAGVPKPESLAPEGAVLGIMPTPQLRERLAERSLNLAVGDTVVFYTDGLTETTNTQRIMWTGKRLHGALTENTGKPPAVVVEALMAQVDAFREGATQHDDQAIVALRRTAAAVEPLQLSGGAPETNLPPHSTNLIGREQEVSDLLGTLTEPDTAVVTVTGTAGIGKTRVALGASSLAVAAYPAGVWLADLSEVDDGEGVCKQVGAALGVDLSSGAAGERLGLALQGRTRTRGGRLLVILDNADQCRAAAAELVGQWRALTRDVVVLVTCRAPLGVNGERAFPLRPLVVPVRKKTERIEKVDDTQVRALARMPSVALFVARAKDRDPGFELTRENADAVGQLCVRLDGIPLAIELAAARAKVLSPQKMVERLNQRFALLRDQRGTSSRQSTLRGALEWSWELLNEPERATLAQLSVCRGGFFLELAEQVVDLSAYPDAPLCMDIVESLHEKSLLDGTELQRLGGERRFAMFESIRAFAAEQLKDKQGAEKRWREGLVAYARGWYERPNSEETRLRLQLELEGLFEVARGDDEPAWYAALMAGPILQRLGSAKSARDILEKAATRCPEGNLRSRLQVARAMVLVHSDPVGAEQILLQVPETSPTYPEAVIALGQTYQNRGKGKQMFELLQKLEQRPGLSPMQRARNVAGLGNSRIMVGDINGGLEYYTKALAAAREIGDTTLEGQVTGNLGVVYNMRNEHHKALKYFDDALKLMQAQEHQIAESYWLVNLGVVHHQLGNLDESEKRLRRALELGQENGLREVTATALGALATVEGKRGNYELALSLAQQAYDIDVAVGNLRGRAARLAQTLDIRKEIGQIEAYMTGLEEVISLSEQAGDVSMVAEHSSKLGLARHDRGDHELAVKWLTVAMRDGLQLNEGRLLHWRVPLAESLAAVGRHDEALGIVREVIAFEPVNEQEKEMIARARKLTG